MAITAVALAAARMLVSLPLVMISTPFVVRDSGWASGWPLS
jgi:hypothetical protein